MIKKSLLKSVTWYPPTQLPETHIMGGTFDMYKRSKYLAVETLDGGVHLGLLVAYTDKGLRQIPGAREVNNQYHILTGNTRDNWDMIYPEDIKGWADLPPDQEVKIVQTQLKTVDWNLLHRKKNKPRQND